MTTITDKLAAALRASVASVQYAVDALQAPERCAMREDLQSAIEALAEYDAQQPQTFAQQCHDFANMLQEAARKELNAAARWRIAGTQVALRNLANDAEADPQDYGDTATPERG